VSQEECVRLRKCIPYVKVYRYNPKHLCPKLNGYGDNGQRKVWSSGALYLSADKSYRCLPLSVVSDDGKSAHTIPRLHMCLFQGTLRRVVNGW